MGVSWWRVMVVVMVWVGVGFGEARRGAVNRVNEWVFEAGREYADPFNEVTVDMVVRGPDGKEVRVPGFWDGGKVWKVRYAGPTVGKYAWRLECSEKEDRGLNGVAGEIELGAYGGENPLFKHGAIRVAGDRRHFEYADGTPFFWLGDTWWMGLCDRLRWPEDVKRLAEDRKGKGFNVIQIVAGLYPDMFPFDERGKNEGGYPWEKEYARINPAYFDAADQRIEYLVEQGFVPCVVGAWGYFLPWMGEKRMEQHWRYLIARWGAMPVVWCAAGEANLPWYLAKGFPYDDREQAAGWVRVMKYIREVDPYHRPLTVHPTGLERLSARHVTGDAEAGVLDFDMLQTPHGQREAVPATVENVRRSYADKPVMPVIDGEASYERLMDSIGTEWTRRMFWLCMMNGAAGHTYGANGIWQVNRKGRPHGASPHHPKGSTGYGVIAWDEAMELGGSTQVGLGKKFLEGYQWWRFEPHPEWAEFAAVMSFEGCEWIWADEGRPAEDAKAGKRWFRRRFEVGKKVEGARLRVSADDRFVVRVNGTEVGRLEAVEGWRVGKEFGDVGRLLRPGGNVIEVEAENMPAAGANPAGVIVKLEVDGEAVVSDGAWDASVDGKEWRKALVLGKHGMKPWGSIDAGEAGGVFGPQACGTEGVRLAYVPEARGVVVKGIAKGARCSALWLDPVTGMRESMRPMRADEAGTVSVAPPAGCDHDWLVVIEPQATVGERR